MKHSIFKKGALVLVALFAVSFFSLQAQNRSNIYDAVDIVKDKLEVIQGKLGLSEQQVRQIQSIDEETESRLDAAPNNTAARKVYEWRDAQYKRVLTAAQFRIYLREKQAIVDEAQAAWSDAHGTPVEY